MTKAKGSKITKVVLVMGITGAGKSYMINEISGREVRIGHCLESCTKEISEVRCKIDGQQVMILDTPGFDDTYRSDAQVLEEFATYLESLYNLGYRISGIIYLHNIMEDRMRGSALKNLQMFARLCGESTYGNMVMLTGRWGAVLQDVAERRENELEEKYWRTFIDGGAQVDRYCSKEDLVRIFKEFFQKPAVALDIQREMSIEGKSLDETAAGQYVNQNVNQELAVLKKKFEEEIAEIAADRANHTKEMRGEMERQRLEFEVKLKKMEVDKFMMMEEKSRRKIAENENLLKDFHRLEQERESQRIEFERKIAAIQAERDEAKKEVVELDALVDYNNTKKKQKEKERGFWMG
ncbi:hypothetical protein BGZ76_000700 [Entomortierella beljakovae]|nr:hypothetical protein BGZ76_000700 [Entomortierella beljakovae]